jgi:DNA-binding NtrC family response regulator
MALCLIARTEGKAPRRYPLPNLLIHIGRSEENDVVLPSFSVSAHHATLSRTDDGFLLSDDGSKNGIVVAGARVPSALLMPMGSVAWLGDTALSIEEGETGEVRMAIAVENTAARTPERDTEVISKPDATTAMQLVADVARGCLDGPQEALARMRAMLRATSAHCIEIVARREAAIVAMSGPEVPADVRERIDKAGPTPRWIERIGSTTVIAAVVELRHMRQIVLATFEGGPREFAPWEKAFFDSMAALLIDRNEAPPIAAVKPPQTERSDSFICESAAMKELVERATRHPLPQDAILLVGESGTGKELMARLLHEHAPHGRRGRFLAVNCANWPEHLADSMLLGIEKRTASEVDPRDGFFVAADGGTLFLDEIGHLSDSMQGKLMRLLQERTVMPLGSHKAKPVNLRIVAATDREERLHDPLRYRFRFRFRVPPLRERDDDVVPLMMHFIREACRERNFARLAVSESALHALRRYPWPGNVRQLESVVHSAVAASEGSGPLHLDHFQLPPADESVPSRESDEERERVRIVSALAHTGGNKAAAAKRLGYSREWLRLAMRRLGITAKRG